MISIAQLHRALKVTGTSQDDYLAGLEAAAVSYLQRRLGWFIGEEEEVTEYIEGSGSARLWLNDEPAAAIDEVLERVAPGADPVTITASGSDGFLHRGKKLVRKNALAWVRGYEYEVTYTRGYQSLEDPSPTNTPPAEVQQMVEFLTAHWFERRQPVPRIGEVHTFPVPHHLESLIQAAKRGRV